MDCVACFEVSAEEYIENFDKVHIGKFEVNFDVFIPLHTLHSYWAHTKQCKCLMLVVVGFENVVGANVGHFIGRCKERFEVEDGHTGLV